MSEENIKIAAETMMSMCNDFLAGGITSKTFVFNVGIFEKNLRKELPKDEAKERKGSFVDTFFKKGE